MSSSGMLHSVGLVRTDISVERIASIITVTRTGQIGTMLAVLATDTCREETRVCVRRLLVTANIPGSPILLAMMIGMLGSSETSVLTRATWHYIPEDGTLHSHCCENLKSYAEQ
jgi:hypothetical protein